MNIDSPRSKIPTSLLGPKERHVSVSTGSMEQPCGSVQPLNVSDALSYLDLVRQQLAEEPRAYEKFLNIMINFKSQM